MPFNLEPNRCPMGPNGNCGKPPSYIVEMVTVHYPISNELDGEIVDDFDYELSGVTIDWDTLDRLYDDGAACPDDEGKVSLGCEAGHEWLAILTEI